MENENYRLFCFQLEEVIRQFPTLSITNKNGLKCLKGILDIPNDQSTIVGSYLVEIHYSKGFPYRFPYLLEVGGDIPNEVNWHKYHDSRCCITVEPDEILKCKHGVNLIEFIQKYCLSFLANHIYRKHNNNYLNGEYSHKRPIALKQFYTELFKKSDLDFWFYCIECSFFNKKITTERNSPCFCGLDKKFKQCHFKIFDSLKDIGLKQLYKDIELIHPHEFFKKFIFKN